jgi:hypothetical protein
MSLARVDNLDHRSRVAAARKAIYENNYAIDGAGVRKLLQHDSLVPTEVRILLPSLE